MGMISRLYTRANLAWINLSDEMCFWFFLKVKYRPPSRMLVDDAGNMAV